MVDSEDRYSTEKAMEVLPRVSLEPQVQISRSSARYSAGSPKNCPEARGGSVRVQISLSRPVNFFMVKPRLCPRQDQFSPVHSRRLLGFGQVLSDQPAASRLEHLLRVLGHIGRTTGTMEDRILPLERMNTKSPFPGVALGCGVKFVTLTGLSLAHHVALPDLGVGLDGQSCSCLIVGWPVGLSSLTLGVGRPSVMFLFDCWSVGRPMLRTVRGCYSRGHSYFIVRERKLGARRRSDTVLVSTINDADQGSADVAFRTPLAPYEKSKFLGSGGSMVARLKLKGIDGRAPPGVEPAA
ncbi:hypothetical protein YC2023_108151 [Brassica napus]